MTEERAARSGGKADRRTNADRICSRNRALESSPEMLEGESPPVSPDDPMLNLMRLLGNFHTTLTNKIENMQQQNTQ